MQTLTTPCRPPVPPPAGAGSIVPPLLAVKEIWGTAPDRVEAVLARYQTLYGLRVIENVFELPPEHLEREQDQLFFALVAIHRGDQAVYLLSKPGDLHPRLPGRALRDKEAPEDAVAALVRLHVQLEPAGMRAIAIVKNQFRLPCRSTNRTHVGIAFDVRVAGNPATQGPRGYFTCTPPEEMFLANRKVLDLALDHPCRPVPIEEATEDHAATWRGKLHSIIVRPLVASRSSTLIQRELVRMLRPANAIIDIACGDDTLVLELARNLGCTLIVGNDICYSAMGRLRTFSRLNGIDAFLTNHDIVELPFATRFDIALAKNVLHHIPGVAEANTILNRLRSLSRTLVLVEYEDPRTSRLGRLWNTYYERCLGDGAVHLHHFLTETKLRRVLQACFSDASTEIRRIWTIKGYCLLAVAEFPL